MFGLLSTPLAASEAGFRVHPYLQHPTPDGMTLLWFSNAATPGQLTYRKADDEMWERSEIAGFEIRATATRCRMSCIFFI